MRLGVAVPTYSHHGHRDGIVRATLKAEALGYDSMWIPDHVLAGGDFLQRMGPTWFEPFSTLGYLAGLTDRIKLGLAVLVVPYRHPIHTAKLVSTLDRLSEGRVILGVGVGHDPHEFRSLGLSLETRGPLTDDYLRALKALWQGGVVEYHGPYCDVPPVAMEPRPLQQPHPPLWVGGNSRAAMRRAAELCDGWHPLKLSPPELAEGVARLREIEDRFGRKEPLTVSLQSEYIRFTDEPLGEDRPPLNGTSEQIAADMRAYAEAGLDSIALRFGLARDTDELIEWMGRFAAEVRPAVAA